jgi:hypothetical protein
MKNKSTIMKVLNKTRHVTNLKSENMWRVSFINALFRAYSILTPVAEVLIHSG